MGAPMKSHPRDDHPFAGTTARPIPDIGGRLGEEVARREANLRLRAMFYPCSARSSKPSNHAHRRPRANQQQALAIFQETGDWRARA